MLERIARRHRLKEMVISPAGKGRLLAQRWPGNARELAHSIEREVIFMEGKPRRLSFEQPRAAPGSPTTALSWQNPAWRVPEEGSSRSIPSIDRDLVKRRAQ